MTALSFKHWGELCHSCVFSTRFLDCRRLPNPKPRIGPKVKVGMVHLFGMRFLGPYLGERWNLVLQVCPWWNGSNVFFVRNSNCWVTVQPIFEVSAFNFAETETTKSHDVGTFQIQRCKKTPPKFRQTSRFFHPLFLSVPKIGAKLCVPTNKTRKLTSTKWKCCASRARSTWGCHVVSVESAKRSSVAVNSNSRTKSDLRYSPVMFVFALKKTWELCACGLFSRWRKTKSSQTSTKKWNDLKSCFT